MKTSVTRLSPWLWMLLAMATALVLVLVAGMASAQDSAGKASGAPTRVQLRVAAPKAGNPGPLSSAQERKLNRGYLVPVRAAYARAKADARTAAQSGAPHTSSRPDSVPTHALAPTDSSGPRPLLPATSRSWQGINDTSVTPPDATSAVGTGRYIELVNDKFAIYNRTGNTPLSQGALSSLFGASSLDFVTDPQVIWDPGTKRFYYSGIQIVSSRDNRLVFGFSTTATPSSSTDFCKYALGFGSKIPDYPKLGDTKNFALIGYNGFNSAKGTYQGSDLVTITKPPAGTACPAASTLPAFVNPNLKATDGTGAFTPVPANQTDTSGKGYVIARASSQSATYLSIFKVTRNASTGAPVVSVKKLTVPSYGVPPNAPQPGTTNLLDTLDGRNTQAVSAIDPTRGTSGKVALWTQHTVFGGSGAMVTYYEVDPATATLFQSTNITGSSGLYLFNGAISPDREVKGTTKLFGDSAVLGFNSSAANQFPNVVTASQVGSTFGGFSAPIVSSSASFNDFGCSGGVCRWGDYSGATPDPAAPTAGTHGQVWLANQFVRNSGSASASGWGTENWIATP